MIKYYKYFIPLFIALIISACNSSDIPNTHKNHIVYRDLDSIQTTNKLKALINYSSTSYFLYKGNPMGFEYELLKKYADHIDVELEVIPIKNMDSVFTNLNKGVGDIIAANLTITQERLRTITFTEPIIITKQVLVQRKPDNWKSMRKKELKGHLLQSPIELADKAVIVREGSSFYSRLKSLSNEIGAPIHVKTVPGETTMEALIEQVAKKEIDYTIADKNIALVNQWNYPNIDASLTISLDQKIAWATRNNSDSLTNSIKYYTLTSGSISPYDEMIKRHAPKVNWDWELLTSLIYQESHFNNKAIGWGGAFGLMQFMPTTGAKFGVDSTSSAEANIIAGTKYIKRLNKMWVSSVPDSLERIKFVLASYNVGPGHVQDAQKLAKKYSDNPAKWDDVGYYLLNKSKPEYYNDDVVKHGYCKGHITFKYVNEIMSRYEHYKNIVRENQLAHQAN
jgi:membrane-bound lytic murein transglycosylase F